MTCETSASRSCMSVGSATETIVVSTRIMKNPMTIAHRASQAWRLVWVTGALMRRCRRRRRPSRTASSVGVVGVVDLADDAAGRDRLTGPGGQAVDASGAMGEQRL